MEFDYILIPISTKEYLHTGCKRGSLNLWTVGLKHEKIQICGDRHNVRIGGIGRILMIELNIIDPKLDVNFRMKYQLIQPFRLFSIVSLVFRNIFIFFLEIPTTRPTLPLYSPIIPFEKHVSSQSSLFAECGMTWTNEHDYYRSKLSRIVGGRQAVPHSHPWQVLLNNRGQFCGGKKKHFFIDFLYNKNVLFSEYS